MGETTLADGAAASGDDGLLSWENLGANAPTRAFFGSLRDLVCRPSSFFRRMAVSGGLHEPVTFLAILIGAGVLAGFVASLTYFGLAAPDPATVSPQDYSAASFPARLSALLAILLPLVLVAGPLAAVMLGTLFHAASKPFGSRNWEGSVSVWLYGVSAALAPLVAALVVVSAVSLAGYLLGIPWSGSRAFTVPLARWTYRVLCAAGLIASLAMLLLCTVRGYVEAFALDATRAAAAAVAGLLCVLVVVALCTWGFSGPGGGVGWALLAAVLLVLVVLTTLSMSAERKRTEGV